MNNSFTKNSLSIILFNANGLKNHVNQLQSVLFNKRIDIALISESHFTKHSYISIPGYSLIKSNNPDGTAHGGAAILIKHNLKYYSLPNYSQNHFQSCAISITINYIPVVIAAIYSPPIYWTTSVRKKPDILDIFVTKNS